MQLLHQGGFFVLLHLLLEQSDLISDFRLSEHFQLDWALFLLRVLLRLISHFCTPRQRIVEIFEVSSDIVRNEAIQDSLWHLLTYFLVVVSQHVTVELRVEPILRTDELSIEICGAACIFHLFQELWHWRPLGSLISLAL